MIHASVWCASVRGSECGYVICRGVRMKDEKYGQNTSISGGWRSLLIDSISDVFETHAIRITIRDLQATQHEMEGMYVYQNNHLSMTRSLYVNTYIHILLMKHCAPTIFFISHCAIHVFIITYIVYFEFQWKN